MGIPCSKPDESPKTPLLQSIMGEKPAIQEEPADEIIKLNVGGHKFTTTRTTLRNIPGSFFESMLRHNGPPARQDDEGYFLIDRDGTQFQHVLNYLRSGTVVTTLDPATRTLLVDDADYYWLDGLKHDLLRPKVDVREHLGDDILSIREEEDSLRNMFASNQASRLDPYASLIPLFHPYNDLQSLPLTFRPRDDNTQNIYMSRIHEQAPAGTPVMVSSFDEFRDSFRRQHRDIIARLETILLEERVIIAGGSVLRALTGLDGIRTSQYWGTRSDVDLFLYGYTVEDANDIAERICLAISDNDEPWVIVRCSGVINIHRQGYELSDTGGNVWGAIEETCQIVLRLYDSPAEVLLGFDVDCCCCAYNGRDVWVSRRCLMALETGTNILNPLHSWPHKPSYELRLAKYAHRGFSIVIPGLDKSLIDYYRIHDVDLDALEGIARLLKASFVPYSGGIPDPRPSYNNGSTTAVIIPSIYEQRIRGIEGRGLLQDLRRLLHRDYRVMFGFGDFVIDQDTTIEAWREIVDAGPNAPLPRRLLDAWVDITEKRSREYMNAKMDKLDLDNAYYSAAYRSVE